MELIRQFLRVHWELLGLILAVLVVLIASWIWFYRQRHRRRQPISSDTFPFEVIRPRSEKVLQRLLGNVWNNETDALADFNIPYQVRQIDRNVRRELEQLLDEKGWVLILGRSGLGKTREAAELAQILSKEGWTILKLQDQDWLDVPRQFPLDKIGSRRKLLFFLDDLNYWMDRGQPDLAPEAAKPFPALALPLQERLLQILKFYQDQCGSEQIRVLATARDQIQESAPKSSDWEKLQFEKYAQFWDRFGIYHLAAPEDQVIVGLLDDTIPKVKIQTRPEDYLRIAQRSDGTFRNIVENLRTVQNRNLPLAPETFPDSLDKTWKKRYNDALKRYPAAKYIYDAIELLQAANVALYDFTVTPTARLIAGGNKFQQLLYRSQIRQALRYLIKTEHILKPHDHQIAAKGKSIEAEIYLSRLSSLLLKLADRHPQKLLVSLLGFAITAVNLKRYPEALAPLNQLLKLIPEFDSAWFLKGYALSALNRKQEAIASYDQALNLKADYPEAWYNRGMALFTLRRYTEAIASYDQALKLQPDDPAAWYHRGIALSSLSRKAEAIASYNQALKLQPNLPQAWYNKGTALSALGRYTAAIASYNQALKLQPNLPQAWYNKGTALSALNRKQEAIKSYNQALRLQPDKAAAWYNRGIALYDLGCWEEAIASYAQVLKLKPDYHQAWHNRGMALYNLGRCQDAVVSYDQALKFKPDKYESWHSRGVALEDLARYEEAIDSYDQALELKSDDPNAWANKGTALSALEWYEEAIACYDQTLNLQPNQPEAWHNRGIALYNLGRYQEAIASYDQALKLKPDQHETWHNRGIALDDLGRREEAVVSYNRALKLKPDYHEAWNNRGYVLMNLGHCQEAVASYDQALKLKPDDADTYYNKACCYGLQGQVELAMQNLQQAIGLSPDEYREMAKMDSDFDNIHADQQFQALLNPSRSRKR